MSQSRADNPTWSEPLSSYSGIPIILGSNNSSEGDMNGAPVKNQTSNNNMVELNDLSHYKMNHGTGSSSTNSTVSLDSVNINGSIKTLNYSAQTAIDIELDDSELTDLLTLKNLYKGCNQHRPKMHMRTLPAIQPEVREEGEVTDMSPLFQRSKSTKSC